MISVDMSIGIYAPDGEMESILFGEKDITNRKNIVIRGT